jgi:uracil-DNA glycosylase
MTGRILIIGEAPSQTGDPSAPLEGAVGARLAEAANISWGRYLVETERRNIFNSPVEPWPFREALIHAQSIWPSLIGRRTILLGKRVAEAFSVKLEILRWADVDDRGTMIAIVPHPSGRNLWWNDPEHRAAARRFLGATFEANR